MNKSKKELYEENRKLKKALKSYSYFWETDALDNTIAELTFIKKKTMDSNQKQRKVFIGDEKGYLHLIIIEYHLLLVFDQYFEQFH